MNIEHDLREALQRKTPPADFASRVLDRIAAEERRAAQPAAPPRWRAIAAALTMTAVLGGWAAREAAHRRASERAGDQVMTALRITSEKLNVARQHVQQIGSETE